MKKAKLIPVLKKLIKKLRDEKTDYQWANMMKCNCGLLVRQITGFGEKELDKAIDNQPGLWEDIGQWDKLPSKDKCSTSELPLKLIYLKLKQYGLTHQNIIQLENLSDPSVIKAMGEDITTFYRDNGGYTNPKRNNREYFITYLETWIKVLSTKKTVTKRVIRKRK